MKLKEASEILSKAFESGIWVSSASKIAQQGIYLLFEKLSEESAAKDQGLFSVVLSLKSLSGLEMLSEVARVRSIIFHDLAQYDFRFLGMELLEEGEHYYYHFSLGVKIGVDNKQ